MNKAVFLDRDGTLNVDTGYTYRIEDFKFFPGAKDAVFRLCNAGYLIIIITNQSGIARGYYTENDYRILMNYIKTLIPVTADYYCPHLSGCKCRKPGTELFYKAAEDFDIDFSKSWAVGDRKRDISICEKEPVRGILLGENCKTLSDAADIILKSCDF